MGMYYVILLHVHDKPLVLFCVVYVRGYFVVLFGKVPIVNVSIRTNIPRALHMVVHPRRCMYTFPEKYHIL